MANAIEEMAARDTLIEEVESILWRYVYNVLPEREIKECLNIALSNHIESLKFAGQSLPK